MSSMPAPVGTRIMVQLFSHGQPNAMMVVYLHHPLTWEHAIPQMLKVCAFTAPRRYGSERATRQNATHCTPALPPPPPLPPPASARGAGSSPMSCGENSSNRPTPPPPPAPYPHEDLYPKFDSPLPLQQTPTSKPLTSPASPSSPPRPRTIAPTAPTRTDPHLTRTDLHLTRTQRTPRPSTCSPPRGRMLAASSSSRRGWRCPRNSFPRSARVSSLCSVSMARTTRRWGPLALAHLRGREAAGQGAGAAPRVARSGIVVYRGGFVLCRLW